MQKSRELLPRLGEPRSIKFASIQLVHRIAASPTSFPCHDGRRRVLIARFVRKGNGVYSSPMAILFYDIGLAFVLPYGKTHYTPLHQPSSARGNISTNPCMPLTAIYSIILYTKSISDSFIHFLHLTCWRARSAPCDFRSNGSY